MYEDEKKRLSENVAWFQRFFSDLTQLFSLIGARLQDEFPLPNIGTYYLTTGRGIKMPPSYMLHLGGESLAVHVVAVFSTEAIKIGPPFKPEPSLVVGRHSRGDVYSFVSQTTLNVLKGKEVRPPARHGDYVSGVFEIGKAAGACYQIFQVLLDPFINNPHPDQAIQVEIIDRLNALPELGNHPL